MSSFDQMRGSFFFIEDDKCEKKSIKPARCKVQDFGGERKDTDKQLKDL